MTFWSTFKTTYSGSIAFLLACPLLALVPVGFELLQHVVEVKIGMYDSIAAAKALEHHPLRMAFGMLKIAALTVPIYWVTRFLPHRDARFAATLDPLAARLFAGVLLFDLVMAALQLFVVPQTGAALAIGFFAGQVIGCLIAAWGAAASLGNRAIGPRVSIALMARHVPWTFAFSLAVMLPLMIPHYALGALALVAPKALMWPVLVADSLLVGWLTAVLAAGAYYVAARAAGKAGVDLMPDRAGTASVLATGRA